jgi:hypothetical protein
MMNVINKLLTFGHV